MEVLLIGSKHMLKEIPGAVLKVRNGALVPTYTARNIGALSDSNLSMNGHIAQMCKGA